MKNPIFESASAAIAPRKQPFKERHAKRRQRGSGSCLCPSRDRRLGKLLGFDAAPAVGNILRNVLLASCGRSDCKPR